MPGRRSRSMYIRVRCAAAGLRISEAHVPNIKIKRLYLCNFSAMSH